MGALPVVSEIANIATGVVGAGTGLFSATEGANYNERALQVQQEENQKNRDFQSLEAQKERDFSQLQQNQLLDYNSAKSQVARLRSAGINPATAFSNSAGSAGSAMSPTRGAVPVGSSGLNIPSFISPMQEISASGAYLKSLADAYKTSEEGSKARELMASQIEKTMAEKDLVQLQQQGTRTANEIAMKTGLRKAEADIKLILNEADLKIHEGALRIAERGLTEAETNRQIEQLVGDVYDNVRKQFEAKYSKNKWKMSEVDVMYHRAEVLEGLKTLRSQQASNYANARNVNAEAEFKEFDNDLRRTNSKQVAENYIDKLHRDQALSQSEYEQAVRLLKSLKFGADADKDTDLFLRWLSTTIGINTGLSVHN